MQAVSLLQDDVPVLRFAGLTAALLISAYFASGCASHLGVVAPASPAGSSKPSPSLVSAASGPKVAGPAKTETAAEMAGQLMSSEDLARLAALSKRRASAVEPFDYRIGPEDVLEISVPDLGDSRGAAAPTGTRVDTASPVASAPSAAGDRGVRVSHHGTIELPLLGEIRAEGLTERELSDEIERRLVSRGILRKPEVGVVVTEFRGRAVTIIGSVTKPGTYPLSKPGATLVDMILVAGGPTESAGRVVHFTPAEDAITTGRAEPQTGAAPTRAHPIRIDLEVLLRSGPTDPDLNPPARPGDLVRVAEEGNVQVEGWVDKPGTFPATSTTTLTGVLAAAGPQFAADLGGVTVRRTLAPGEQRTYTVDVTDIVAGGTPDLPLADGDVVTVPVHAGKVVPFSLYQVGKQVINVGVGGMVPLF